MNHIGMLTLLLIGVTSVNASATKVEYGFSQCKGSMGDFDVYVTKTQSNPSLFLLSIVPVKADQEGDIVSVTLVSSKTGGYRQAVQQVVLKNQEEVNTGFLTQQELNQYDQVALTPFDPSTSFAGRTSVKDAFCTLPQVGK